MEFSRAAAADLDAIDEYTIERFGLGQAIVMTQRFHEALRSLAELPRSGVVRPELSPPGRAFRFRSILGSFVVVYEIRDGTIRVARTLHGARNLLAELERDAGEDG